ncbi:hypothetical protein L1049_024979 [Liquidambar formosana]|uniref:Epidermal patterning factor-like protein n=1 Tax=Liquidambar formosana TaxID=63359 RepID=A0AAP0RWL0_LIQFO
MAMNSPNSNLLCTTILVITLIHFLISPASCFNQHHSPDSPRGLLVEEKSRLGSIPPSCHNKCNKCHPCMAVQVPTLPNHDRFRPDPSRATPMEFYDPSPPGAGNSTVANPNQNDQNVSTPLMGDVRWLEGL